MKHKKILLITAVATVVSALFRTVQLFIFTDGTTGFIKSSNASSFFAMLTMLIYAFSAVVIFIPTAFLGRRRPAHAPDLNDYKHLNIMTFVMGALSLVCGIPTWLSGGVTSLWGLIGLASCIFSCLFFVIYGLSFRSKLHCPAVFSTAPIIMFIYLTVKSFIDATGMVLITENIIKTVCLCLGILFFSIHGKVLSEVNFRSSSRQIYSVGLVFFLFGIVYSVPPFILVMLGKASLVHGGITADHFVALISGVYAFIFTTTLYSKKLIAKHKKTTETLDFVSPEASTEFYHN